MSSSEGENPPDDENEYLSETYERIVAELEKYELHRNTILFGKTKVQPKLPAFVKHSRVEKESRKGKNRKAPKRRGHHNERDKFRTKRMNRDRDIKRNIHRGARPHFRWSNSMWFQMLGPTVSYIVLRRERKAREYQERLQKRINDEKELEKARTKLILGRKSSGFVDHRPLKKLEPGAKYWLPKKLDFMERRAKFHFSAITAMDSDEKKAHYLAQLRRCDANDQKQNKEEWSENGESFEVDATVLIRTILGHFHTEDLARMVDLLEKYADKRSLVTEQVLLASITRTLNAARKTLLGGSHDTKLESPLAVKAFDSSGYANDFCVVQPLDTTEKVHPIIPLEVGCWTKTLKYGELSIVPCKEAFEFAFDVFSNQFFRGVNITGGIIAGGSISACLQPLRGSYLRDFVEYRQKLRAVRQLPVPSYILDRILDFADLEGDTLEFFRTKLAKFYSKTYHTSDIDIFIIANSLDEAETKLKRLCKNIKHRFKQLNAEYVISRTGNAITFCSKDYRNIQIVVSTLRTLDDFLLFCDMDCTSCAYDGREVYMSPRSMRAFNKRYNVISPSQLNSQITRARLLKYAFRGFSTLIFELPKDTPRSDGTLQSDPQKHFDKLQGASVREKSNMMAFGEYTEQRPMFFSWHSKEKMEKYFLERGVPYGQKLKDVWRHSLDGEKNEKKERENGHEGEGDGGGGRGGRGGGRGRGRGRRRGEWGGEEGEGGTGRAEGGEVPVAEMRWKWMDTLMSHDVDHLLPRCYMCRKRSVPGFQPEKTGLTLCTECVKKNKEMMDQWDTINNIDECVALVTGARIKIGYFIALRLLRSGATVIASTRFPHDAALKYSKEPDFDKWKHKLHIYGVDLRHLPSVNEFIGHVVGRYKRIDMLINNAAQTKRRPRAYYYEVIQRERALMGTELAENFLVKNFSSDPFLIEYEASPDSKAVLDLKRNASSALVPVMAAGEIALDPSLPKSAALTQVQLHPMDTKERDDELFPPGMVDEHNEPLDTRPSTTWNQKIDEISTVELMEVQIVNSTVPFMLISSFTPLLKEAAAISYHKRAFVVNVTAVEGIFSKNKRSGGHPHTNMAKAALNMMTKSIGDTFAQSHIYTTAVDTGWCTEMRFVPMHERDASGVPLHPVPLTDKDGAARVLYPIFVGLTSEEPPPHGVLYHDFQVVPWI